MKNDKDNKLNKLKEIIRGYDSLAVAFSGGVDSTFLLKIASEVLGDKLIAVTISASLFPEKETEKAVSFCTKMGIKQIMVPLEEFEIDGFDQNPVDRCYICKKKVFSKIISVATSENINHIAEGSNVDDEADYRPGSRALSEYQIHSPLKEAGLSKEEIRELSKELSLPTWDKPSLACLASRIAYGEIITKEKLRRIELAEQYLVDLGLSQVRVRIHGEDGLIARIEVLPEEFPKLLTDKARVDIHSKFIELGFKYVSLDMKGYRTGSMNEKLLSVN